MSSLSQFLAPGQAQAIAGAAINSTMQNGAAVYPLLELYPDGNAYPVDVTDYAAVPNAGTAITPPTTLPQYMLPQSGSALSNSLAVQGPDKSAYLLTAAGTASTVGLNICRISAGGVYMTNVVINAAQNVTAGNIFFLSNGNICITYTTTASYFVIFSPVNMAVVVAPTVIGAGGYTNLVSRPLAAGGFAVFCNTAATAGTLSIFSNSGVLQGTATVTTTSTTSGNGCSIAQLSNGNILVVYQGSASHAFTIFNTSGVVQTAQTSTGMAAAGSASFLYISYLSGYFALAGLTTTTTIACSIWSNAGVQQGPTYSDTNTGTAGASASNPIVNDGTSFWLGYTSLVAASTYAGILVNIATTGNSIATYPLGNVNYAYANLTTYAFNVLFDGKSNVVLYLGTSAGIVFAAFNVKSFALVTPSTAVGTLAGNGYGNASFPAGDGAIFVLTGSSATAGGAAAAYAVWKTVNTAILGPATAAAAANAGVPIDISAGYKRIAPVGGSPSKAFNHKSGTGIYGNAGAVMSMTAAQQGM